MAVKRHLWLLALLTLLILGALVRYRRAPSASTEPPSPSLPLPLAGEGRGEGVQRESLTPPSPATGGRGKIEESPTEEAPVDGRGAGLKEKGESLFGGKR